MVGRSVRSPLKLLTSTKQSPRSTVAWNRLDEFRVRISVQGVSSPHLKR